MPYRLTKIYTRSGDDGYTHLQDKRRSKDDALVAAVGTIDELNAYLGLLCVLEIEADSKTKLASIQNELFDLGGELHVPTHPVITQAHIDALEKCIDAINSNLPPLTEFVLPGGNILAANYHIARTVCRRAERCLVHLLRETGLANSFLLAYLNRLSDLLFVLARQAARRDGGEEILWKQSKMR